jgi:hypothetical protein
VCVWRLLYKGIDGYQVDNDCVQGSAAGTVLLLGYDIDVWGFGPRSSGIVSIELASIVDTTLCLRKCLVEGFKVYFRDSDSFFTEVSQYFVFTITFAKIHTQNVSWLLLNHLI